MGMGRETEAQGKEGPFQKSLGTLEASKQQRQGEVLLPHLCEGLQSDGDRGQAVGPLNPKLHLCLEGSLGEYKRGVQLLSAPEKHLLLLPTGPQTLASL